MFADKLKVFNYSQRTDPSNIILEAVDRKLKTELDAVKAPKASNL